MLVDIDGYTRWVNTQSSWSIYFMIKRMNFILDLVRSSAF